MTDSSALQPILEASICCSVVIILLVLQSRAFGLYRTIRGMFTGLPVGLLLFSVLHSWLPDNSNSKPLSIGPEIQLQATALDGQPIQLTDYRGKVVLIEFWASWSPVSRGEVAQLKELWRKYKDKGLVLLGVSLDDEIRDIQTFLEAEEVTWPQVVFYQQDQRGAQNPIAKQFDAWTLPSNRLLDRNGFLIGKDYRGEDLTHAVMNALETPFGQYTRWKNWTAMLLGLLVGCTASTWMASRRIATSGHAAPTAES